MIARAKPAIVIAVSAPAPSETFAIIGDYGTGSATEKAVADLVASWHPSYVLAVGDAHYPSAGGSGTGKYDKSTGAYYGPWIKDYSASGAHYPIGTTVTNAFFPVLGNHDYNDNSGHSADSYLAYFTLPGRTFANSSGNERYYDFAEGPIHFFALNSNPEEPDGTSATSVQANWLQRQLAASTSTWNIVFDHHPPYSSALMHGSSEYMRWPFKKWGADAMFSGHNHVYERVMNDGVPYITDGLGGAPRYAFGMPVAGSVDRYSGDYGAEKVTVSDTGLTLEFYNVKGQLIDHYTVSAK